jgi:hypothetical protein
MSQEPDSLQTRLARLAAEIRPERDLWPAIDARLGDRRPAWHIGLGIAAGVAILALSLIVSLKPRAPTTVMTPSRPVSARAGVPQTPPKRPTDAARAASFERTQQTLERSFQSELARLPKGTQTRLLADLDVIRKARTDIGAALTANPNSPLLQALRADTWQQEMEFYANVSSTPDAAGMRWPL